MCKFSILHKMFWVLWFILFSKCLVIFVLNQSEISAFKSISYYIRSINVNEKCPISSIDKNIHWTVLSRNDKNQPTKLHNRWLIPFFFFRRECDCFQLSSDWTAPSACVLTSRQSWPYSFIDHKAIVRIQSHHFVQWNDFSSLLRLFLLLIPNAQMPKINNSNNTDFGSF